MLKFFTDHKGSVTIMLLIIMLPMLVFSFTVVDLCKIFMAQDVANDATQLAMNAGMTSFDKVLKDMYGILATSESEEDLSKKMSLYYAATLSANGLDPAEFDPEKIISGLIGNIDAIPKELKEKNDSFLVIKPETVDGTNFVTAHKLPSSAASNPNVLKRQIVEYMKYRAPVNMAMGIFDKIKALKDLPNQAAATTERINFEKKLSAINNNAIYAYTEMEVYFYNNKRAEKDDEKLEIVYPNDDDTKKNLISTYKYEGGAVAAGDLFKNSTVFKDLIKELKKSSVSLYFTSMFSSTSKVGNQSSMPSWSPSLLEEGNERSLNNAMGNPKWSMQNGRESDYEDFETSNSLLKGAADSVVSYTIDELDRRLFGDVRVFYTRSYMDTSHQGPPPLTMYLILQNGVSTVDKYYEELEAVLSGAQSSVDSSAAENMFALMKTIGYLSPLYGDAQNISGMDKGISNAIKTFMRAYELTEAEQGEEDSIDSYSTTLRQNIMEMLVNMNRVIYTIRSKGNTAYANAVNKYTNLNDFVTKQKNLLDDMTKANSYLEQVVNDFKDAQDATDGYQKAINKVETDTQKNSEQSTYDKEAALVNEVKIEGLTVIKEKLESKKIYYTKVSEALKSLEICFEYGTGVKLFSGGSAKQKLGSYLTNQMANDFWSSSDYDGWSRRAENKSPEYSFMNENLGISAWTECNEEDDIRKTSLYTEIIKLSVPSVETKQDDSVQKNVKESVPSGGSSDALPENVQDAQEADGEDEGTAKDKADDFKTMANKERFSTYIAGVPEANETLTSPEFTGLEAADNSQKVDNNVDMGGSDEDITKNANDLMASVSSLFSELGTLFLDLAESGRDAIYVTEYLTGNFPCHTTGKDGNGNRTTSEKMLCGEPFYKDDNGKVVRTVGFDHELEYILYGLDSETANVAAAGAVIFGIRFVLNLIYSFTDAEIRSFTLSVATAAGGIFPFSIPLIQTVLHIGLALAESGIDLYYLMKGAAVPLYKTPSTWYCKGTNIIRKAAGELISSVSNALINEAEDALCNAIVEANESAGNFLTEQEDKVDEYVNEKLDSLQEEVSAAIKGPIYDVVQEVVLNINKYATDIKNEAGNITMNVNSEAKTEIKKQIEDALARVRQTAEDQGADNLVAVGIKSALDAVDVDSIADKITTNLADLVTASVDSTVDQFEEDATGVVKSIYGKFEEKVDSVLSDLNKTLTDVWDKTKTTIDAKIREGLSLVATELQNGVHKGADEVRNLINEKVNGLVTGHVDKKITSADKCESGQLVLNMTYKDYIYIFTLIGAMANSSNMLERAALVMQYNCNQNGAKNDGDDYNLNKAATLFYCKSSASVSTVFYGAVFRDGVLDLSGKKRYEFSLASYMGY